MADVLDLFSYVQYWAPVMCEVLVIGGKCERPVAPLMEPIFLRGERDHKQNSSNHIASKAWQVF